MAAGTFDGQPLTKYIPAPGECTYVRRRALEVLAELGDRESVSALQSAGLDMDEQLSETFYWMTRVIFGRLL
jgi:hypothetical protein